MSDTKRSLSVCVWPSFPSSHHCRWFTATVAPHFSSSEREKSSRKILDPFSPSWKPGLNFERMECEPYQLLSCFAVNKFLSPRRRSTFAQSLFFHFPNQLGRKTFQFYWQNLLCFLSAPRVISQLEKGDAGRARSRNWLDNVREMNWKYLVTHSPSFPRIVQRVTFFKPILWDSLSGFLFSMSFDFEIGCEVEMPIESEHGIMCSATQCQLELITHNRVGEGKEKMW